jgi:hypothetical protein
MKPIDGWSIDPASVEPLSREVERLCPLVLETESTAREQQLFGTWWMLPFARSWGGDLVGLRLLPGVPRAECPVVRAMGPGAVTVASRPACLVPTMVFAKMLEGTYDWLLASELLDGEWEELAGLHAALGGSDGLSALRAVVLDESLREACANPESESWNDAATEGFVRLDPSPETAIYRRYLQRAVATGEAPAPPPSAGCWNAALASLSFLVNRAGSRDPAGRANELRAAWAVINQPSGIDTSWRERPSHACLLDPAAGARLVYSAARRLAERPAEIPMTWKYDPLWAVARALVDAGSPSRYDGTAHLQAAALLDDEVGDRERAFAALMSVGFWNYLALDRSLSPPREAARWMAERYGWKDLLESLSSMFPPE